jgi:hypothetical protein
MDHEVRGHTSNRPWQEWWDVSMREFRWGWLKRTAVGLAACCALLLAAPCPGAAYQHARSRVSYHEYSEEAFRLAERTGRPIFIVLAAKWCYWCRAYERETLEREEVATFLNRNFVNVFVDLDERQDLQHRYVQRGIPTSVILRPDGRQYLTFSGILPPADFLAGMHEVLKGLAQPAAKHRSGARYSVRDVRPLLEPGGAPAITAARAERLAAEFRELALANYDAAFAGFGTEQKYPQGALLTELLLATPEEPSALRPAVLSTLDRIRAHLLDRVEGGFHRYAERRDWSSVRYEKMLVPNVALVRAFQAAGSAGPGREDAARRAEHAAVARDALRFVLAVYYQPARGGFSGSVEGTSQRYFRSDRAQRARMQAPAVDATIYTAWNAEAVAVLADVQRAQPEPALQAALARTLALLDEKLSTPRQGVHGRLDPATGTVRGLGQLGDNAWAALAFAIGHEGSGEARYRAAMERTLDYALRELWLAEVHAFRAWSIPAGSDVRPSERVSDAVPLRENAVMGLALVQAHRLTGNPRYRSAAQELLAALAVLEPDQFDDNPGDGGKRYLEAFAIYHKALRALTQPN